MTNKELEANKKNLRERQRQALKDAGVTDYENLGRDFHGLIPNKLLEKFEKEENELRCIDMLHSILTYGSGGESKVTDVMKNRYLQNYIETLGENRVKELIENEIEEFNNATIVRDTYTDSEGLTYNSVIFKDDKSDDFEPDI